MVKLDRVTLERGVTRRQSTYKAATMIQETDLKILSKEDGRENTRTEDTQDTIVLPILMINI